jgi:4-hydroxybenzoate polyprenyltransferase
MKLKYFLQLIRYKNLLLLVFVQVLFSFSIIISNNLLSTFDIIKLVLLVQSTILLASAGYVINDFFDVEVDKINKPNKVFVGHLISGKNTLLLYFILNFFGIISGLVLAYLSHKIIYGLIFIAISIVLYLYSKSFKKIALLGNFMVSFFIALSIYLIYIFPSFDSGIFISHPSVYFILIIYTVFAFILNLIREILKDIEDIDGDNKLNMKTLPIIIGRKRTLYILFTLTIIPLISTIYLTFGVLKDTIIILYSLFFIICPLGYFMYKIIDVKSKKEFHKLSMFLKIIMFLGLVSIVFIHY